MKRFSHVLFKLQMMKPFQLALTAVVRLALNFIITSHSAAGPIGQDPAPFSTWKLAFLRADKP